MVSLKLEFSLQITALEIFLLFAGTPLICFGRTMASTWPKWGEYWMTSTTLRFESGRQFTAASFTKLVYPMNLA